MPDGRWVWRPGFYSFGKDGSELLNPSSNRLIRHINAAFHHKLFNLAQAQIKPKIQPDNTLDDIRMETAAMINGDVHPANLAANAKTAT